MTDREPRLAMVQIEPVDERYERGLQALQAGVAALERWAYQAQASGGYPELFDAVAESSFASGVLALAPEAAEATRAAGLAEENQRKLEARVREDQARAGEEQKVVSRRNSDNGKKGAEKRIEQLGLQPLKDWVEDMAKNSSWPTNKKTRVEKARWLILKAGKAFPDAKWPTNNLERLITDKLKSLGV